MLAQKVEKHELLEFRRVAAYIYKKEKRFQRSVELSKEDRMYKDAIDTAAESKDSDICEELLRFFVANKDKACFTATLYSCYDLVRPDVAVELAWRNGYTDFAMPYIIQYMRHTHEKIEKIDARTAPPKQEEAQAEDNSAAVYGMGMMMNETLMIQNGPTAYVPGVAYGAGNIPDPYAQPQGYGNPSMNFGPAYGGGGYY